MGERFGGLFSFSWAQFATLEEPEQEATAVFRFIRHLEKNF
jgi:hypothetical protein